VGGVRSLDELRLVGSQTKGIKVANMVEGGITPLCSAPQLAEMGFGLVVYPLSALYAATRALQDVYGALARTGSSQEAWESMVSWRAFNEVVGLEEKFAREEHFTAVQGPASDISDRLRVRVKGLVKPVSVQ
jgi:2-methylisocitrate lyase-like PEP mutase family enzyme